MDAGSRSDEETSRVDQFNFDRLEQSVDFLISEHQRLSGEKEELLSELLEREHRISMLEGRLEDERRKRATAVEGVDKILGRLEQLQSSVGTGSEGSS
jgi:chromosome segregation ATPase